ncbi:MAG: glycosyltransferase family 2 protein [Candidatus Portnoybacteria bacterium]|nr:glycosyltransferase family 2 protein [Candidatus Portnoybacteria bacterium]
MLPKEKYYLKLGKASDLKSPRERWLYRAFEILPGALAWLTLLSIIFLSWLKPVWIALFIISFDVYWLLKTIYLSFHLRAGYKRMKKQMAIDWLEKIKSLTDKDWQKIRHLIILPFYKESLSTIRSTFQAVVNSTYPKDKMIVVLAIEERAGQRAAKVAQIIKKEFGQQFYQFLITVHPQDIVGELAGKGANATWAARQVKKKIIDPLKIPYQDIIVSCFDIDTQVYPQYFSVLTYYYLTVKNPTRASYQPIPIYNNNIWQAPCLSRVVATSGTFWQMMQQQRPERLSTFSSQSISFQALVEVDFWPTNMVSEDSRIFWQNLLFHYGHYRTIPLHYPVSMDANLAPNFFKTAFNIYRQQRRWGWGVENIPFLFFGFYKNKKIGWSKKFHWIWIQLEGFWSWATNALLLFLLGWLPLFLGGQKFNVTLLSYNLPRVTRTLMTLAMIGLVGSAIYSTLLLPARPKEYGLLKGCFRYLAMVIQWILLPFTILFFGCLPGLDSQTRLMLGKYMGFWVTPKQKKKSRE